MVVDILEVESLFQRYLANPMRDWSGEIPYVLKSSDADIYNLDPKQVVILIDIEDVRYEKISFTLNATHYSMFLRARTKTDKSSEAEFDKKLKQITNDIERFIRTDDMLVYQEIFARRLRPNIEQIEWPLSGQALRDRGLAFIEPVPIPENTRDVDLMRYPGIFDETLEDITIHPYHEYYLDDYGTDKIINNRYERVYGYRYNLDRLRFRGLLPNGTVRDYLLSDDTIDNEDVELIDTDIHENYTQINIKPSELGSFELINTFFTYIDRDDGRGGQLSLPFARELRNETLVRVSVYE